MTTPKKVIISFLLSVFLLAGIAFFAYTGFLDMIESRFYNAAVTKTLVRETARDAQILSDHLEGLQGRFADVLYSPAVYRSFLPDQDAAEIYERSMLFGLLMELVTGLQWVRLVDADGIRIHFSTYPQDIVRANSTLVRYRNYGDDSASLPFYEVAASEQDRAKLTLDKAGGRVIFSFPVYDSFDIYRGVALFAVSMRSLEESLIAAGRAGAAEKLALCVAADAGAAGIVSGLPGISGEEILAGVSAVWAEGYRTVVPFFAADVVLVLVGARMAQGFYYGRIVNEDVFVLPLPLQLLALAALFLTLFLTLFFIFSLRRSSARVKAKKPGAEESLEELERVDYPVRSPAARGSATRGQGLLATAALLAPGGQTAAPADVIFERNGIPYINSNVFYEDKNSEAKLDSNFVKLIESLTPSAPGN